MLRHLRRIIDIVTGIVKERSTEYLQVELRELENIFALLVAAPLIGLPTPLTAVSLRILPYMIPELAVMERLSQRLDDMLSELASIFEVT